MKILHIINSLACGGAEKLVADLSVLMNTLDNTCSILVLTNSDNIYREKLEAQGIIVYSLNSNKIMSLKCFNNLCHFLKNSDFDIINAHLFPSLYYVSLYSFFYHDDAKFVFTEHNTFNKRRQYKIFKYIEKFIYSNFQRVICISSGTEYSLKTWIPSNNTHRIVTINNGIYLPTFYNAEPYPKDHFFTKENILLCMVGSITKQKNHELFLDILQGLPSKYCAIIVGIGPLLENIKKEAQLKNIDNRILFLGYRSDVARIMKSSDIIVIPSKWEGFGLIAAEAMASGKPIVCSNVRGLNEVVDSAGFIVNNLKEYITAILNLEKEETYKEYSRRSKERSSLFSIDKMNKKYLELYEKLL